jgi:ankyrin repeat protein
LGDAPKLDLEASNDAGETGLMMAALRGQIELCKRLIERGAKVNREGWTPLHYAASGGGEQVTALMLAAGARIDARAPNGATALMLAVRFDTEATINLLLSRGASLTARSKAGLNAADYAAGIGRDYLVPRLTPKPADKR